MEQAKFNPTNQRLQPLPKLDVDWLAERAEILLSAYRRDDYVDPMKFVTQLGMVLERYSKEVVEHVTSPVTGLQRRCKFPPSLAEVVEACENEAARLDRIKELGTLKSVSVPRARKTNFANVYVGSDTPQYKKMLQKANDPKTDKREFRYDEERGGLWVSQKWIWG